MCFISPPNFKGHSVCMVIIKHCIVFQKPLNPLGLSLEPQKLAYCCRGTRSSRAACRSLELGAAKTGLAVKVWKASRDEVAVGVWLRNAG